MGRKAKAIWLDNYEGSIKVRRRMKCVVSDLQLRIRQNMGSIHLILGILPKTNFSKELFTKDCLERGLGTKLPQKYLSYCVFFNDAEEPGYVQLHINKNHTFVFKRLTNLEACEAIEKARKLFKPYLKEKK